MRGAICKSGLSFCTKLRHQNLYLTLINSNDKAHTETHTQTYTHTLEYLMELRCTSTCDLRLLHDIIFSRVLNNISVARKPFVSSYQGFH